jgi:ribokinase
LAPPNPKQSHKTNKQNNQSKPICSIQQEAKPIKWKTPTSLFCHKSLQDTNPPLVVVGSANADIYVEIDRLPKEGETVSAKTGQTLAGGKGANQAACGGKLSYPTYFVGQVGDDAHGKLIIEALENDGVRLDYLNTVDAAPTGHAVVMLQPDGQNSIIIVGGANMNCWPEPLSEKELEVVRNAGIVLLQREIPDSVNIQVAKVRNLKHFNSCF